MRISGYVSINNSSLLLPNGSNIFNTGDISILNNHSGVGDPQYPRHIKNVLVKNITLSGPYKVVVNVNSTGVTTLPSSSSQFDYIGISLPNKFDMMLQILDKKAVAEFTISNTTGNICSSYKDYKQGTNSIS